MDEQTSLEILPGQTFLGLTIKDEKQTMSIEIDDIEQLITIKQAINLVMRNMLKNDVQ